MLYRKRRAALMILILLAFSAAGFAEDPPQTEIIEDASGKSDMHAISGHVLHEKRGLKIHRVASHFKVYPQDPLDVLPGPVPVLGFCRGEYEPFQIVVRSEADLADVTVDVAGLPEGVSFECQPVGVVDIKTSKERTGLTPDPLHNEPCFDVMAGQSQSFWMTLRAARDAAPGSFEMSCRVLSGEKELAAFSLRGRVWDFPMPVRPHLASMAEFRPWNDNGHYGGESHALFRWPIERQAKVYRAHYRWYQRNRMQPGSMFPRPDIRKNDDGQYELLNGEEVNRYFQEYLRDFPGVFDVLWIQRLMGYGTKFPDPDSEEGREKIAHICEYVRLYIDLAKRYDWPLERFVWYAGDEPISPHATRGDGSSKDMPIKALVACVRAVRPVLEGVPVLVSAWPFDRELLSAVDIWSGRSYGHPSTVMPRMQVIEANNYGKALAITTDNSYNILMDREAINHRLDPWHAWYAAVPMIEHWSNMYWPKTPWTPDENWFSPTFVVPGDGNLVYPPPKEDEVISSIRAELMREGMEDYEYLWLLRHASHAIRTCGRGGEEADLLRRIDDHLWDSREWVIRNTNRTRDFDYIGICSNVPGGQVRSAAAELDGLRSGMQETLEAIHRKGYFDTAVIDAGQKPIRQWFRYD